MKNPVQKMLKAAGQMKNNPQLAQRVAQSPNKVNAIAAQMVIPEQQAMQNSKPIPHPVGSVLMQKLAQAQQAALAAKMPQPSEGGIAQMAAKGGVLKFAGAGKVPKGRRGKKKTGTVSQQTQQEFLDKYGAGPSSATPTDFMKEAFDTAKADVDQRRQQQIENVQESNLRAPESKIKKEVESLKGIASSAKSPVSPTLQRKRDVVGDKVRREEHPTKRLMLTEEEVPQALAEKFGRDQAKLIYERAKEDIRVNQEEARNLNRLGERNLREDQIKDAKRRAAANALKTQEGRNKPKLDGTPRVTAESRRQQADILRENNKKSSIIGEKGKVVPKQPETPEQKARRSKVSEELGLPKKKGIASAASKEAKAYLEAEKPVLTPASPAEVERPTTRAKQKYSELTTAEKTGQRSSRAGIPTNKGPGPAVSGKATPAAPAEVEAPASTMPSKKKTADVTQGEATARLQKAKAEGQAARGETPATLHSKVEGITEGAIHGDPEVHDEVSRLASSFKAQNPDATVEQMGTHIMDNASEATKAKFMAKAGPLLQKYGVRLGKAAGAIGAYESAANIGNVAIDPTKSKADVARAMGHEAVGAVPALTGAALGAGAGTLTGPAAPVAVPVLGLAGGIAGAVGGDPAVSWMKEKLGMDQEGPQATARHTIPTVGDIASKVSEQFSGDNWNKSPAQQFKDEVAAMPEDEETLRLERMGRGEMSLPEIARGTAEPAAPQTAPGSSSGNAPSTGKGITSSPALRSSATGGGGASTVPAGGAAAPSVPQAPRTETQAAQDQYAGDTSEGTPEGAVRELMKLRGPGYSYSPEVMGMLKDARDEDRQATALSMLAGIGAGLANRDRYAGAHDAALLANQAFTSGREREDAAQQRFLQGIIHNEQVPFEQRQAAYEMYTKMQMAAAQNEALMARANLTGMYGLGKADIAARSREATQRDQYAKLFVNSMQKDIGQLQRQLATDFSLTDEDKQRINNEIDGLRQQVAMARSNMTDQSDVLSGLAGGETLGQNRPITTLKM